MVKNSGQKVGSGINQRDAAIIAGARKALVTVFRNGCLCIESVSSDVGKDYPKAATQLLKEMQPQENDVVVVAGADSALRLSEELLRLVGLLSRFKWCIFRLHLICALKQC